MRMGSLCVSRQVGANIETLEMIERWTKDGKTFISARERFDANTSAGRFTLGMMLLVAKFYRDRISEDGMRVPRTPWAVAYTSRSRTAIGAGMGTGNPMRRVGPWIAARC